MDKLFSKTVEICMISIGMVLKWDQKEGLSLCSMEAAIINAS